jgi:hypothetical protein
MNVQMSDSKRLLKVIVVLLGMTLLMNFSFINKALSVWVPLELIVFINGLLIAAIIILVKKSND